MNKFSSFKVAILFSFVAIVLAVSPGIYSLCVNGESLSYSPEISVLTATLIAIIWYTAYTYDNLEYQRNKADQEVESLSTALLSEVRWIYDLLFEFAQNGNFSNANTPTPLPTPILDSVIKDLSKFQDDTVNRITYVHRGLSHFEHHRERHQNNHGLETDSIRSIAALVCIGIAELVQELENEGGQLPELMDEEGVQAHRIREILPDDPFAEIRNDDE